MSPPPQAGPYDDGFFSYTDRISRSSAEAVVPVLQGLLPHVASVADFGCARGTWLAAWARAGVGDYQGVDGGYVAAESLLIPPGRFHACDLNGAIDLGRRFDMAYSFEVAEHLRPEASARFVDSLTRHADLVLFGASPPGQGGLGHVNERDYGFWRGLFRERGYAAFDPLRPLLRGRDEVAYWYRYNVLLYANEKGAERLDPAVLGTRIDDGAPVPDVSPPLFRLRKAVVRRLPPVLCDGLARLKARAVAGRPG